MSCVDFISGVHAAVPAHQAAGMTVHAGFCGPRRNCVNTRHADAWSVCNNCNAHNRAKLLLEAASPPNNVMPRIPGAPDYPINNFDRIANVTLGSSPVWNAWFPLVGTMPGGPLGPPAGPTPIALQPGAPDPPWGGFLARVCYVCERMIRSEQHYLTHGLIPHGPAITRVRWADPFRSSCTCRYDLDFTQQAGRAGPRLCHEHRLAKLRQLERTKDANDKWLRSIMLHPGTKNIVRATPFILNARMGINTTWRACRCGEELPNDRAPEVLICMACEGYVSVAPLAASVWNAAGFLPLRTTTSAHLYTLRAPLPRTNQRSPLSHFDLSRSKIATTPFAISTMATSFRHLGELPTELQLEIMRLIALSDRITIPPKGLSAFSPPLFYVSRFMMVFTSKDMFSKYRGVLEESIIRDKQVTTAIIKDYNFTNFKKMMTSVQMIGAKMKKPAMERFCFPCSGKDAPSLENITGAYFRLNLHFTAAFASDDESKLPAYLRFTQALQRKHGKQHFRIFYTVAKVEDSRALGKMISGLSFDDSAQGQLRFLLAALQKAFGRDLAAEMLGLPMRGWGDDDINRGLVWDNQEDTYWEEAKEVEMGDEVVEEEDEVEEEMEIEEDNVEEDEEDDVENDVEDDVEMEKEVREEDEEIKDEEIKDEEIKDEVEDEVKVKQEKEEEGSDSEEVDEPDYAEIGLRAWLQERTYRLALARQAAQLTQGMEG
ncbi:hypothetical protein LTR59_008324 [Friedmanniomyces endolithicus]|nr:hypothetical protein LTR94_010244 [Friedmanniomyces endolithicus]KAK0788419.1 hypothetical protein LTR38_011301 [Friedmanniomyces endolithicus]KAK0792952.1 hypothetical protein LTR59_008324 [Friedmanniomyces endolithicus]KAK0802495.1 hypothetical protein LTR75_008270 [Friedmanniomyces endolithicus]KAK0839811.1 hypothetical protein LTR03_011000 [Friedmanniomyces endolithicus]